MISLVNPIFSYFDSFRDFNLTTWIASFPIILRDEYSNWWWEESANEQSNHHKLFVTRAASCDTLIIVSSILGNS